MKWSVGDSYTQETLWQTVYLALEGVKKELQDMSAAIVKAAEENHLKRQMTEDEFYISVISTSDGKICDSLIPVNCNPTSLPSYFVYA